MDPIEKFVAITPASIIDDNREEAARCCDETAKWQRGQRPPLNMFTEFSGHAFGVASEVALVVRDALVEAGVHWRPDFPWTAAATLLRAGWQRGHKLEPHVIKAGAKN